MLAVGGILGIPDGASAVLVPIAVATFGGVLTRRLTASAVGTTGHQGHAADRKGGHERIGGPATRGDHQSHVQ
ncbi:hypothetical protein HMPREF0290_1068 [Corynebacterium efficiens YS-314]|nr:hypothetical protein HMPREF0290_1068 [Corynebacterium efficiens YS-314]